MAVHVAQPACVWGIIPTSLRNVEFESFHHFMRFLIKSLTNPPAGNIRTFCFIVGFRPDLGPFFRRSEENCCYNTTNKTTKSILVAIHSATAHESVSRNVCCLLFCFVLILIYSFLVSLSFGFVFFHLFSCLFSIFPLYKNLLSCTKSTLLYTCVYLVLLALFISFFGLKQGHTP